MYQVTDGGSLDADGIENGIIKDPAGIASASDDPTLADTGSELYLTPLVGIVIIVVTVRIAKYTKPEN